MLRDHGTTAHYVAKSVQRAINLFMFMILGSTAIDTAFAADPLFSQTVVLEPMVFQASSWPLRRQRGNAKSAALP